MTPEIIFYPIIIVINIFLSYFIFETTDDPASFMIIICRNCTSGLRGVKNLKNSGRGKLKQTIHTDK